jgi:hypothetical protein
VIVGPQLIERFRRAYAMAVRKDDLNMSWITRVAAVHRNGRNQ